MTNRLWASDAPPHLVVLTGAGISAESGLKTFRDGGGLWEGHDVHVVCNFDTWRRNITAVHRFYNDRRASAAHSEPNAAHRAVAAWQQRWPTHVLTQNVDDLLERGGCQTVTHLHGRLSDMWCMACGHRWTHGGGAWTLGTDGCPGCASKHDVKPGIVFFGEAAPEYATMLATLNSLRSIDVLLVIGTSGYVLPVGEFARANPGLSLLNNLEPSGHFDDRLFDHVLYSPATQAAAQLTPLLESALGTAKVW